MPMIGARFRFCREQKKLSQGDIEKRTGLRRCYLSRVENCHTIPSVETLQKLARSLDLSLYQLLYDGDEPPAKQLPIDGDLWGSSGKKARFLTKLRGCLSKMSAEERKLLFTVARVITKKPKKKSDESLIH
jgi:transcriptional regulator with XRE-family HTH domain